MIQLEQLKAYYPPKLSSNVIFQKYIVKEYVQLLILDFLSDSKWVKKVCFIGGTSLRLVKGIDRFSEDIDFDCKNFSKEEFTEMTNDVILFLKRAGLDVIFKEKESGRLSAFRRSFYFPELLYSLGLSGHREERFLVKIKCEDQGFDYKPANAVIEGCGFYFNFPVPHESVLCAMKIAAMLSRAKGRDFYDAIFLMKRTKPDFSHLKSKCGISNSAELKAAVKNLLNKTDLEKKSKDFEHLLFEKKNSAKIFDILRAV